MSNNMFQAIEPKSDQLNSDDLIGKTMTVKITSVDVKNSKEQPVSVFFEGDNGKPYKPSKSMCRVMVHAWGGDSSKYSGYSMTLYRNPKVTWGGLEVGGIEISHMSGLTENMTVALTASKGKRRAFTVKPLTAESEAGEPTISEEQAMTIDAACSERGVSVADFKSFAGIELVVDLPAKHYKRALAWIDKQAASAKAE
jgi:hypothetical protein